MWDLFSGRAQYGARHHGRYTPRGRILHAFELGRAIAVARPIPRRDAMVALDKNPILELERYYPAARPRSREVHAGERPSCPIRPWDNGCGAVVFWTKAINDLSPAAGALIGTPPAT
jgi:hypothetical protein